MLFNSYTFIFLYLPIVFSIFFLLCKNRLITAAKTWLLLSSLFFYGYWDVRFLPLLIGSIFFNYGCGNQIFKSSSMNQKKGWLIVGIIADLSLLFYFKYSNFFLTNILGTSASFVDVVLPLGISFFTFTQIAYLVDVYQEKTGQCHLISYGLFVTIFPHLIAGPILHHKPMIKQFNNLRMYIFQWPNIAQGIALFTLGLSKKVLIADSLISPVATIFDSGIVHLSFVQAWFGALAYTIQLYFDFSGYSDMAVGLGLLFNLHLPINFNSPYQADSIIDFWRRWHITLSNFLKDYLYIPLGGNRYGKNSQLRNLLLTMFLGGLWHGAGWTFIVWGLCHGCFLVVNHLWRETHLSLPGFLSKGITLLAVIVAWVIFRSPDLTTAVQILKGMIGLNGMALPEKFEPFLGFLTYVGVSFSVFLHTDIRWYDFLFVFILFGAVLFIPNSNYWVKKMNNRPTRWGFAYSLLMICNIINFSKVSEFLYYQF